MLHFVSRWLCYMLNRMIGKTLTQAVSLRFGEERFLFAVVSCEKVVWPYQSGGEKKERKIEESRKEEEEN